LVVTQQMTQTITTPQENQITIEQKQLAKATPIQTPLTHTPPNKVDIILEVCKERDYLKTIRQDIETGAQRPSNKLKALLYVTQIIISANKVALDGLKENTINITENNISIHEEIKKIVTFGTELDCKFANDPKHA
jgi:hypothetical protein